MPVHDVYVVQGADGDWVVSNRKCTLARYQSQYGPMAFARALAIAAAWARSFSSWTAAVVGMPVHPSRIHVTL